MMRVLHLVAGLGAGGAEKQLFLLCRHTAQDVRHAVLSLSGEGRWVAPLQDCGVQVRDLAGASPRDPRSLIRLRGRIGGEAPDVVHCWLPSMNILGALVSLCLPKPRPRLIASVRNVDDWKPLPYRLVERLAAPFWDAVICNSRAGLALTASSGVPASKLHLVPNGIVERPCVTDEERVAARRSFGLTGTPLVVSTASRLVPQKRVDRFLEVAAAVLSSVPDARFLIAGDGPLRNEIRAASRNFGNSVQLLGEVADTRPVLAASDLFLLCSEREGMSNSLIEAMQAGCVPVVTGVGDNGFLVESGSSGLVADARQMPQAVLTLHGNRPLLNRFAMAAAARAAQFSVASMATQTLAVYKRVTNPQEAHPTVPCYE